MDNSRSPWRAHHFVSICNQKTVFDLVSLSTFFSLHSDITSP